MYKMVTVVTTAVGHRKIVQRVNPKSSHHKKRQK